MILSTLLIESTTPNHLKNNANDCIPSLNTPSHLAPLYRDSITPIKN